MNIIFRTLFLGGLIVTLAGHLGWGGQVQMEFKKALWPNTYYLIVDNTDSDRAIEFRGGWEEPGEKTNYYVITNDENRRYFSSSMFKDVGVKGMLWIPPGKSVKIPFKISDDIIKNAQHIVFKGFSFILTKDNGVTDQKDYRDLTITYDVGKENFKTVISDTPIKQGDGTHFSKNNGFHKMSDGKKQLSVDQIRPTDSLEVIDVDDFGKSQE